MSIEKGRELFQSVYSSIISSNVKVVRGKFLKHRSVQETQLSSLLIAFKQKGWKNPFKTCPKQIRFLGKLIDRRR